MTITYINEQFRKRFGTLGEIYTPQFALSQYDAIEVYAVTAEDGICEVTLDRKDADLWSVYFHLRSGGVECVADFPAEHLELAYNYANHVSSYTGWPIYGYTKEVANG
ncbi:hypothetical protein [Geomonas subterranea]|uniref:hypothetical protein n=1 Tax=Geomonas subterranea TaxID=2847989 RepID=UPI001CD1AC45|nr:hypothetical protein [Geomonas fuzhouensis]